MMRTTYTKVLALILALVMTVSLLPMTVLADEPAAATFSAAMTMLPIDGIVPMMR
jgi:hypothetical protein